MNPRSFYVGVLQFALAGAVLLLSHYGYSWLAALLVLAPAAIGWLRAGRSWDTLLQASPTALIGLSVVVLVGLSRPPLGQPVFPVVSQVILTLFYAGWLVWLRQLRLQRRASMLVAGVQQVIGVSAVFLAAAFWHWPQTLVVALVCAIVGVTTLWYFRINEERAASIVALAWALVAGEIAWVLYSWEVNYVIGSNNAIIVPQTAMIILGVGYCFASIYHAHSEKRLSRRRLIEYVAIAGVLLAIVIAGTRWNGAA